MSFAPVILVIVCILVFMALHFTLLVWGWIDILGRRQDLDGGNKFLWCMLLFFVPFMPIIYPFTSSGAYNWMRHLSRICMGCVVVGIIGVIFSISQISQFFLHDLKSGSNSYSYSFNWNDKQFALTPAADDSGSFSEEQVGKYYDLCTKDSDGEACYQLAVAYRDGNGTEANEQHAKYYFKKACDLKFMKACDL